MRDLKVIVFKLNNELCGVDSVQVQEIVKYFETSKLTGMPEFIEGVITLRGKVIPVIDLNKRFEIGQTEITETAKIIITKTDENLVGYLVNDVTEILNILDDDIEAPPEMILKAGNSHLLGIGKVGSKLISILNLDKVLISSELTDIEKLNK